MRGIAIATVLVLLSIECHAQMQTTPNPGQCEQVRSAIQQYGLQASRQHAMANYGLSATDVRNIEQGCGIGGGASNGGGSKRAKR
jgi:hypothetical protein